MAFLCIDEKFLFACGEENRRLHDQPHAQNRFLQAQTPLMAPAKGPPSSWDLHPLTTRAELAPWLALTPAELAWFADVQSRGGKITEGPLTHYRYHWQPKASGSARLIECPKSRLKAIQRRVLDEILAKIPPHDAAHGFRLGRSIRTYIEPHIGQYVVLKLDLRHFFPSVGFAQVLAVFRTAGYPEAVAQALAGICTNAVPPRVWRDPACPLVGDELWRTRQVFWRPHLPQGAPSSPALANLCFRSLDARLSALASMAGARYTRYADDLAFSGGPEFARGVDRFHIQVAAIAIEAGFAIQTRKTRLMRRGGRQKIGGVVVNEVPNVPRDDYDLLKATLYNCVQHGPEAQNRRKLPDFRAHLAGRVQYVATLNPARGRKLMSMFERIAW